MRCIAPLFAVAVFWLSATGEASCATDTTEPPISPQTAAPMDATYLSKAQAKLGFRLIGRMTRATNGRSNVVVSPASVAAVLALLDVGASGEMRAALFRTLAFGRGSDAEVSAKLAALRASVKSIQAGAVGGPLTSANAIVFDPKAEPYPKILPALADVGAQVSVENLEDPATIKRINDWVKERTGGLIPSILEKTPGDGGLVALNALHFKDRWKDAFDPSLTGPAMFHRVGGAASEVPMMHLPDGKLRFRQQGDFVAVELPYATDRFRLVLITSKDKPARAKAFGRVAEWLTGDGFMEGPGELSVPRFGLGSSADILGALDALGLKRGRASPTALAGLSPAPMTIAQVLQRTELRVDESGTEAAAATAATTTRALSTDFVKVMVDKPFLFALRDVSTGLVLLTGYVGNPKVAPS
jgi:serine protease inhibitor